MKCQHQYNGLSVTEKFSPTFHHMVSSEESTIGEKGEYSVFRHTTLGVAESRAPRLLVGTVKPDETPVAFYAYMSTNEVNVGPHHSLIFDHVETNIGNGYNSHTGIFLAPYSGIYLFAYTTHAERSSFFSIEIVVNSVSRGAVFVDNGQVQIYTGCTGIAVLFLNQGDDCFIRTHSTYLPQGTIASKSIWRTSFSGVKI